MVRRPTRLREGDLVALVGTSGWVRPHQASAAVKALQEWGLRVRAGRHALDRHFYLAGTDEQRLVDVNDALRDPEVRAVLSLRGGHGALRIVDGLDVAAVRDDPKLVVGFSDITALHVALWCESRLATVHGPVAVSLDRGLGNPTVESVRRALMTADPIVVGADVKEETFSVRVGGCAEGVLLGGNLVLLAAIVGSRHRPDLRGAILLIEATREEPYRVDRMLVQVKRAGWFDGVAGVAVGQFTLCHDDGPTPSVSQVLSEQLGVLGVPVLGGLPIGHGPEQVAVGLGVPAVLDADRGTLTIQPVGR
jgi:muramoyltetrapeptide carboxypeptidase